MVGIRLVDDTECSATLLLMETCAQRDNIVGNKGAISVEQSKWGEEGQLEEG